MNRIRLNAREIQEIYDLFNKMNESSDYGTIELEQSDCDGVLGELKATMWVTHREVEGDFTVTITSEMEL